MAYEKDYLNMDTDGEEFSLESILAEYKGAAYISGDRKTPEDILNARTEQILREIRGQSSSASAPREEAEPVRQPDAATPSRREKVRKEEPVITREEVELEYEKTAPAYELMQRHFRARKEREEEAEEPPVPGATPPEPEKAERKKKGRLFGKKEREPDAFSAIEEESDEEREERSRARRARIRQLFSAENEYGEEDEAEEEDEGFWREAQPDPQDEPDDFHEEEEEQPHREKHTRVISSDLQPDEDEPDYKEKARDFTVGLRLVTLRCLVGAVLAGVLVLITCLFEGGRSLPLIGRSDAAMTGTALLMQLTVMLLGLDILLSGAEDLLHGAPGTESLVLISSLLTVLDGVYMLISGNYLSGMPFSAVSACGIVVALWGKKQYRLGLYYSLKTASAAASPYGVAAEYGTIEDRMILKKITGSTRGFYRMLVGADVTETAYGMLTPVLLIAGVLFAIVSTILLGRPQQFTYALAGIFSLSTAFTAFFAYALPFKKTASQARKSGAAVAGWLGACEIYEADGALITDDDVFPKGTLSMNGIKIFEGVSQQKAIVYASSMVIASGSGLSKLFSELLRSNGYSSLPVENFGCYEGGIGARIRGEDVLVGTAGFMNLMGIRIPSSINLKNALFLAIDRDLTAAFAVNYIPANSVQSALVSMIRTKVSMLFAVRDFNVTPHMLHQKFRVPTDGIEYIRVEDCYSISVDVVPEGSKVSAILCREGLGPFAQSITGGRMLKIGAKLLTGLSIVSSVVGMLLGFYLCCTGSVANITVGSVLLYQFLLCAAAVILSMIVNRRK